MNKRNCLKKKYYIYIYLFIIAYFLGYVFMRKQKGYSK